MTFRPQSARWFELVTTKAHLAAALGALALTGAVEIESRVHVDHAVLPNLDDLLKTYRTVARSYGAYWPSPKAIPPSGDPRVLLEDDWRRVAEWRMEADPTIARIEALARERVDLSALVEALARAGDEFPDLERLAGAGPRVAAILVRFPPHTAFGEGMRGALTIRWDAPEAIHVLVIGAPDEIREIACQATNLKGRPIPFPDWLPASPAEARAAIAARLETCAAEIEELEAELVALSKRRSIAEAIGDFTLFEWLQEHAADLVGGTRLVFVTGWTSAESGAELQQELDRRGSSSRPISSAWRGSSARTRCRRRSS